MPRKKQSNPAHRLRGENTDVQKSSEEFEVCGHARTTQDVEVLSVPQE